MSEKVKLTMEQAEAIESFDSDPKCEVVHQHVTIGWQFEENKCLNELSLDEIIKALYIGYEVEETFEVGDWVVRTDEGIKYKGELYRKGRLFKIYRIDENLDCPVICEEMGGHSKKTLRHATPEEIAEEKQRRWWAKHGRDVWELRENDLLYYDDEFKEVEEVLKIGAIMLSSERVYLPLEIIKSKYSVACFADDRKDIDGGDNE